jgi:putative flippase GtrA
LEILQAEIAIKFLMYAVVGFSGVLVDFGFTYVCKELLKFQKYVSNSIGFCAAVISNYFLNRLWTFKSQDPKLLSQFGNFALIAAVGLILNNLIIYVLNDKLKFNFYLSKAMAIGIVMIWNFFANYFYTFKA